VKELGKLAERVEPLVDTARGAASAKMRAAVESLGAQPEETRARILQEIALHGERTDIREELDRIRGHLDHALAKLEQDEPCGRALDFLCQELAREWNTLSVKAASAEINRIALEGKEQVERFREQVQNVE
jgi:uncharacterized protein (TIGR00255 family)